MSTAPQFNNHVEPIKRTAVPGTTYRQLPDHHILWIESGNGVYQIDFHNYSYNGKRILFLSPGQYFTVVTGSFELKEIALPASLLAHNPRLITDSRVLFTHVYEAGAVVPSPHFPDLPEMNHLHTWLRDAARHWRAQKPFHPHITPRETNLIFDLRQLIETHYQEQRPVRDYVRALDLSAKWVNRITTSCINRTIGELVRSRQLLEAKRELVFSDKAVNEIAYALDFADPAYFSRVFSRAVGVSPVAFRASYAASRVDPFLEEVWALIEQHFRHTRSVAFYAEQLFLTPKALSAKVKGITGKPLSHLIIDRVIIEARRLLTTSDIPVQEIAWYLGFEEAPHFSRFFKRATGQAPTFFRQQH